MIWLQAMQLPPVKPQPRTTSVYGLVVDVPQWLSERTPMNPRSAPRKPQPFLFVFWRPSASRICLVSQPERVSTCPSLLSCSLNHCFPTSKGEKATSHRRWPVVGAWMSSTTKVERGNSLSHQTEFPLPSRLGRRW